MIAVLPIENKQEQAALCARCGATCGALWLAYGAYEGDAFLGLCQFGRDADGGHIYTLDSLPGVGDEDTLFLLGRAALNFLDLCGSETADYLGKDMKEKKEILRRIGFAVDGEGCPKMTLTGFFDTPCKH